MKFLDMRGKPCPMPVVEAKKALFAEAPGQGGVIVRVDNITAVQNLEKMAGGMGFTLNYIKLELDGDIFDVCIVPQGVKPQTVTPPSQKDSPNPLIAIGADSMGRGDDSLGKILIKGFIYALTVLESPPAGVLLFNGGVKLAAEGSNVVPDLKTLMNRGAELLCCGTCCNFYGIKPSVGEITDMYGILSRMAGSTKLIQIN